MKKKSLVRWITSDYSFYHNFRVDYGELNLCSLWKTKKDAIKYSEQYWNHSGKVKKIRLTISDA